MTTYVIGDVQGCYQELMALLEAINFSVEHDTLWFTGDLINRGPESLAVLRFVKQLGERAISVLGNHDLHALAVARGFEKQRPKDTLSELLNAPDKTELLEWLIQLPLIHIEDNNILVHAGIYPGWSIPQAMELADEVHAALSTEERDDFFRNMYGDQPDHWDENLTSWSRLRFVTNCFTRMRYCYPHLTLQFKSKGPPGTQAAGLKPWYSYLNNEHLSHRIFFGHWSTLGIISHQQVFSLDTGCLWGGKLTAINLHNTKKIVQVACKVSQKPI